MAEKLLLSAILMDLQFRENNGIRMVLKSITAPVSPDKTKVLMLNPQKYLFLSHPLQEFRMLVNTFHYSLMRS